MCFGKKAGSTTIKIADNTTGMDYRMSFTVIASVPFKIDRGNGLTNQTQPLIVDFEGKWKITSSYGWSVYSPNNGIIKVTDINHNNGTITFKALRSDISYISGKPGLTYIQITEKETGAWQKHWVQVKPYVTGIKISGFSGPVAGDVQNLTAKTYSQNYVGQKGHGTIIWSSSNANIATVNQNGKVSFLAPGSVKITVTYSDGKHPSKSAYVDYKVGKLASKLKVTDVVLRDVQNKTTIIKGQSIMWNIKSAKGWKISSPNNGIIKLSWNKNNNTVTFTGNNYGTTTITISEYYTGISKTYTIEVRKPSEVKFNLNNISMKVGDKKTITYSTNYNEKVTWKIENTNIAGVTVDYSNKKITIEGKKPGTTSIKIWLDNGNYSVCNINVEYIKGIDVSEFQGVINWKAVAQTQDFAIIRVGGRYSNSKEFYEDKYFKTNVKGAQDAGIKYGVYFYSTAKSVTDAEEEASWFLKKIKGYKITYPVMLDYEDESVLSLTTAKRTEIVSKFLNIIANNGYKPILYGEQTWLDMSKLNTYDFCLAYYPEDRYDGSGSPENGYKRNPNYSGQFTMWQYTAKGRVNGINGEVDKIICYKKY